MPVKAPDRSDFKLVRGDTKDRTYTITGLGEDTDTGQTFFTVNTEGAADDSEAPLKIDSTSNAAQFAYPSADQVVITLLPANTSSLDPTVSYMYDVQHKLVDGTIKSLALGKFIVERDYTVRTT